MPAHPSEREISDSEGDASKVETQKRKHCTYTHFPKDRNCDICLRTKITRVPCRTRDEGSTPRAEKFGDLITADHKVSMKEVNPRTTIGTLSCYKISPLSGYNLIRARTRIRRRRRRVYENFWSRHKSQKLFSDNSLEFGKSCEELSWNHRTSTPYRSETNGIAERAIRRVEEGTSAVLLQS